MKNRPNYKTRFYLLLGVVIIMILLAWKLAVNRTIESHREFKQLRENITHYQNPDKVIARLQSQLSIVRDERLPGPDEIDESLMNIVSQNLVRYNIRLEEFPETHRFRSNNYLIQTYRLRFSGRFTDLLKFIHFAEYEFLSCRIVSVRFNREEIRSTGEKLFVNVYFQSFYRNQ